MRRRITLLIVALATLVFAPMGVAAQTPGDLTIAEVAQAVDTGDLATLRAAAEDEALTAEIGSDQEMLIALWMSLAEAC